METNQKKKHIERARKFVENSLEEKFKLSLEDYHNFLISKFLLLTESIIIKKGDKKISFNYGDNQEYLYIIKEIVDKFESQGVLLPNELDIEIIEDSTSRHLAKDEIEYVKKYIQKFYKLRDTLAHGAYDFDSENNQIILNNTKTSPNQREQYSIIGPFSFELFEIFNFNFENPRKKDERKPEVKDECKLYYNDYYKNKNTLNYSFIEKKYWPSKYNNLKYDKDLYINELSNFLKTPQDFERILKILISDYDLKKSKKELSSKEIEIFNELLIIANKLLKEKYKSKTKVILKSKEKTRESEKTIEELKQSFANVVLQMAKILDIDLTVFKKDKKEIGIFIIQSISLYNYMQMFLSNGFDELKTKYDQGDLETIELLSHLQMKNIQIEFKDNQIDKGIEKEVAGITKALNGLINGYKNGNDVNIKAKKLQEIDKKIKEFSDTMSVKLAKRNIEALRCIRNSIEHGGYTPQGDEIKLVDVEDKTQLNTTTTNNDQKTFTCSGKIKNLFELTLNIETGKISSDFKIIEELKNIVSEETYKAFVESLGKVQRIKISTLPKYQIPGSGKFHKK